jgi:xanthine dehydrogenase YagR molybdenum-binding subunit
LREKSVDLEDRVRPGCGIAAGRCAPLGNRGAGAAVANAVYNATGIRVREFPITLDKLLPALPVMAS